MANDAPGPVAAQSPSDLATFTRKVLIVAGVALAALGLLALLWYAAEILMLAFAGILLAIIISWPADALARATSMPRLLALGLVALGLVVIVGTVGYASGARIAGQVKLLQESLPPAFDAFQRDMEQNPVGQWVLEQTPRLREFLGNSNLLSRVPNLLSSTFGVVGNIVIVIVLAIFVAFNPKMYADGTAMLVPGSYRPRFRYVLTRSAQTLQWWFLGQLMSMTVIGILTWIGLTILGVPLALTLAMLAALLNFIPNFGPIIAAIPAVLLALAPHAGQPNIELMSAVWVILLYVVVQMLEGSLITPIIQANAVDLPAALIIVFQVLLGIAVGPIGLILATPFLAALLVFVKMIYIEDTLGEQTEMAKSREERRRSRWFGKK